MAAAGVEHQGAVAAKGGVPAVLATATTGSAASAAQNSRHQRSFSEFSKGFSSGVVSILVSYPVGKLVTRQQVDGHSIFRAASHMWQEGAGRLYQGAQPLLVQRGIQIGIMYTLYSDVHTRLRQQAAGKAPDWSLRFGAGLVAGVADAVVLTPLERTQSLMQLRSKHLIGREPLAGTADAITMLHSYGMREFYRGMVCAMVRNGLCNGVYFMLLPNARARFEKIRQRAHERQWVIRNWFGPVQEDFACGVGLGCGVSLFVFPLSTAMKRLQMVTGGAHMSILTALSIVKQDRGGILGVYRGLPMYMLRSALTWGVTSTVYCALGGGGGDGRD